MRGLDVQIASPRTLVLHLAAEHRDNREARTFCRTRYQRSFQLPEIIRTLETRRCEFARGMSGFVNYVTVETTDGERYAAFFELPFKDAGVKRDTTDGAVCVCTRSREANAWEGRIHLHALLGHVLRGTMPRIPP
jgi:hypothetical protein